MIEALFILRMFILYFLIFCSLGHISFIGLVKGKMGQQIDRFWLPKYINILSGGHLTR